MGKHLDYAGLLYFWGKVKQRLATKADTEQITTLNSKITALEQRIANLEKPYVWGDLIKDKKVGD